MYIFSPFFTAVYIVERLVLQTIYVVNKEILQFLSLRSAVYNLDKFNGARTIGKQGYIARDEFLVFECACPED